VHPTLRQAQVRQQAEALKAERALLQEEIVRRTRAVEQLTHEALHDPLTGLTNRRLFFNRLEHALAWSKRKLDNLWAVLDLDLNRFNCQRWSRRRSRRSAADTGR
jgi:GGDEF domain-containing protein